MNKSEILKNIKAIINSILPDARVLLFGSRAKGKYKQVELVDEKGFLTELSLTELKNSIPEIPAEKLIHGLRENDIPKLLTIGVFVRLIEEKLA